MIVDDLKDSADSLAKLLGLSEAQDRRRTEEVGFNDHMVKPVDPGALMKLLARLPVEKKTSDRSQFDSE